MNLHEAEFIAGELIAFYFAVRSIIWASRQYVPPPDDDLERPEPSEFSSLNDD